MRTDESAKRMHFDLKKKIEPYRDLGNAYEPANVGDEEKSLRKNPGNVLFWKSNEDSIACWK